MSDGTTNRFYSEANMRLGLLAFKLAATVDSARAPVSIRVSPALSDCASYITMRVGINYAISALWDLVHKAGADVRIQASNNGSEMWLAHEGLIKGSWFSTWLITDGLMRPGRYSYNITDRGSYRDVSIASIVIALDDAAVKLEESLKIFGLNPNEEHMVEIAEEIERCRNWRHYESST